jgi:hypothetical protein
MTLIASQMSPRAQTVALGDSWRVRTQTAFAAVTAIPTTTAPFVLFNGESQTSGVGKSYAIDSIALARIVVDATQSDTSAVFAMVSAGAVAAPTDDTGMTIRSLSGRKLYDGLARKAVAQTVVDVTWFPIGNSSFVTSVLGGGPWNTAEFNLDGLIVLPPGRTLNLVVIQVAGAAAQCHLDVRWHEAFLPVVA